jgi:hypothetical protein
VRKAVIAAVVAVLVTAWLVIPPGMMPTLASDHPTDNESTRARLAALARSKVFADAATKRSDTPIDQITCRFLNTPAKGTTAKFDCTLDDGSRLRVKYGWTGETQAEVAATHLLAALGFGADDVSMARRVRCYGCPRWPMLVRQAAGRLHLDTLLEKRLDFDRYTDFEWVSVERRDRQQDLKFGDEEGWSWSELSVVDPALGGATHAETDAFRLMAMFLNHWDNKASNQRLVCRGVSDSAGTPHCDHPLAIIQDAGSTFGPKKVNLQSWDQSAVWADASSCTISMKHLPYGGGTFSDVRVSEEGRRLLSDRLERLTASSLTALFTNAHFDDVERWVAAFVRRAEAITHRPPCPSSS